MSGSRAGMRRRGYKWTQGKFGGVSLFIILIVVMVSRDIHMPKFKLYFIFIKVLIYVNFSAYWISVTPQLNFF